MTYFITIAGRRWLVEVGHLCYLSSGICLSRLPSLSFFLRFAGFCLGWCPAGAGVVAGRAVPRSRSSRICCSSAVMIQFLPPGARRAVLS